jgi:hypothetical protein
VNGKSLPNGGLLLIMIERHKLYGPFSSAHAAPSAYVKHIDQPYQQG